MGDIEELYPYQEKLYAHVLNGKNVILQAPTGAGKTFAALWPFLENLGTHYHPKRFHQSPLPLTCRYAVPMRVLATQFHRDYQSADKRLDHALGSTLENVYGRLNIGVPSIQTGETPDDPKFESPLTFCTIDQLLASFIGTPYSVGRGSANINVGAVLGSYLIFDEFHLYPLEKTGNGARMTTLAMLQMLAGFSPFVMMTATFSTELLEELGKLLGAEVVRVTDDAELAKIMGGRSRTICRADDIMTPDAILAAHAQASARNAGASLVVCNTVARAQDTYTQLICALESTRMLERFNVQLLHSRFTPEDRQEKSKNLEQSLGEACWQDGRFIPHDGREVIVVGTQVVEVGLNISAGVLHTELVPANSLIQRAGRCARFAKQQGEVIVYKIPPREGSDTVSYKPYDEDPSIATWDYLGEHAGGSGLAFDFKQEQALIDHVHTKADQAMIALFRKGDIGIKRKIRGVLADHERGKERELIRDVAQVDIVIHSAPEKDITTKPFEWQAFGMHPGTLAGAWDKLKERADHLGLGWTIKELQQEGDTDKDALGAEGDNDRQTTYTWVDMPLSSDNAYPLIRAALRVALPPQLAAYDDKLGFRLMLTADAAEGTWQSRRRKLFDKGKKDDGGGRQGSYVHHISGLMNAYTLSVRSEFDWLARRLGSAMQLPSDKLDLALRLAIACHDIGKLCQDWQHWAREWQKLLVQKRGEGYVIKPGNTWLAKTDRLLPHEWRTEKDWQKELGISRPHHACEGAIASRDFIEAVLVGDNADTLTDDESKSLDALLCASVNAIARHHAPLSKAYQDVAWHGTARVAIYEALTACGIPTDHATEIDLSARNGAEIMADDLISPDSASLHAIWLSFALVRALRLCDQRAERV